MCDQIIRMALQTSSNDILNRKNDKNWVNVKIMRITTISVCSSYKTNVNLEGLDIVHESYANF